MKLVMIFILTLTMTAGGFVDAMQSEPSIVQAQSPPSGFDLNDDFRNVNMASESGTLINEDFDDGIAQGFNNEVGDWEVVDGKYTATEETFRFSTAGNLDWQDYSIEADFVSAKDGGFLCRAQDYDNAIVLIVRPAHNDIYWLVRKNAGWGAQYNSEKLGYERGEDLHVKVDVEGDQFTAYINGEMKTSFESAEYSSGKIGLYLYYQSDQYWDNVLVSGAGSSVGSDVVSESEFSVDMSAPTTETSVGGSLEYGIELRNRQNSSDTFDIDVTGIDSSWIITDTSCELMAGAAKEIPLEISVPEDASGGEFTVLAEVTSSSLGTTKESSAPLSVSLEPLITNLVPLDNAHTGSDEVLFSWDTSVQSSSEVFIKAEGETEYYSATGRPGTSHIVSMNLTRNTSYEFYVQSQTGEHTARSEVREIFVDSGVAFVKDSYEFTVERDYDQKVQISIKNNDSEPHELLLSVSRPPDDLAVGFVGDGSMDKVVALRPGQAKHVTLAVHTQDALSEDYTLLLDLAHLDGIEMHDYADLKLHVRFPVVDFRIDEIKTDPNTLAKTMRITNNGDTITDFTVEADGSLSHLVSFNPSISHANLKTHRTIEFSVAPILSKFVNQEDPSELTGKIIARGAGDVIELPVTFSIPEGEGIFFGDPPSPGVSAKVLKEQLGEYCTNDPEINEIIANEGYLNCSELTEEQVETILVTIAENIATAPDPTSLTGIGISLIKTADVNTCAAMVAFTKIKMTEALTDPRGPQYGKYYFYEEIHQDWKMRQHNLEMSQLEDDPISITPDGDVYYRTGSEWEPCEQVIVSTGELKTEANSRAYLTWGGSCTIMEESGQLEIVHSSDKPFFSQEMDISQGSSLWHIKFGDFLAHTPHAQMVFTDADAFNNVDSAFNINVTETDTIIEVRRGSLDVTHTGSGKSYNVAKGYRAIANSSGIDVSEFELPRRSHIEGIPNVAEAKLIIDFSLPWPAKTYKEHGVDILINGNVIGQLDDTIPEGKYIFDVDPSLINDGVNEGAANTITLNTTHLNGGHYVVTAGMQLVYRCSSLDIPVIAASQNEADEKVKNIAHVDWSGADLAVYANSFDLSNPSPQQGQSVTIDATVFNVGVPSLYDVEVVLLDNDIEIGSEMIECIHTNETVSFNWRATAGEHQLKIMVNPDEVVDEIQFENNEATMIIDISGSDTTPPILSNPQPEDGITVFDTMPLMCLDLADSDSGINNESIQIKLDNADVTQKSTVSSEMAWYTPDNALAEGLHEVSVYTEDNEGNSQTLDWSFTVQAGITSYDLDDSGTINKQEALDAIEACLVDSTISEGLAIEIVRAYLLGIPVQ